MQALCGPGGDGLDGGQPGQHLQPPLTDTPSLRFFDRVLSLETQITCGI